MFTFIANYYFKNQQPNKHTYTPTPTDKHTMIYPIILHTNQSVLDSYLYKCTNMAIFLSTVFNLILIDKMCFNILYK